MSTSRSGKNQTSIRNATKQAELTASGKTKLKPGQQAGGSWHSSSVGGGEFTLSAFDNLRIDAENELRRAEQELQGGGDLLERARAGLYATTKPWDRQEGEPLHWYMRFEQFRRLGPQAAPVDVANIERIQQGRPRSKDLTRPWREKIRDWKWVERRDAYFVWLVNLQRQKEYDLLNREAEALEQEKIAQRSIRMNLLKSIESKLGLALQNLDPADISKHRGLARWITDTAEMVIVQSRQEWDDEPVTRRAEQDTVENEMPPPSGNIVNIHNNLTLDLDQRLALLNGSGNQLTGDAYDPREYMLEWQKVMQEINVINADGTMGEGFNLAYPALTEAGENVDYADYINGEAEEVIE